MSEPIHEQDRRRPRLPVLHAPAGPAALTADVAGRPIEGAGHVVELTDRTLVVEVEDPAVALAFSLAPEVTVVIDLGVGSRTVVAEPGRRAGDNPTSRRVELVLRASID